MNTDFSLLDRQLTLIRYPKAHQHKSLQAWDSADELIIEHINASHITPAEGRCIIFNDDFGALGCWFANSHPAWSSDSYIAHRSLEENLQANQLAVEKAEGFIRAPVHAISSLAPLPEEAELVVFKIPRTLALLEQQLIELRKVITPACEIVAGGKVKAITRSVLQLFETYLGPTTTSLASKKSRLIFVKPDQLVLSRPVKSPYPVVWQSTCSNGKDVTVHNHANVFSRQSLDIGARLLLDNMHVDDGDHVVDLGCGNGVLGLNALAIAAPASVTFVDESYMALASAKENVMVNFPQSAEKTRFVASNCLESLITENPRPVVNKVLCNPPFHQQNALTDHIAWQMFHDARDILVKGGHLVVVANRHLDYHHKLKRLFGGTKLLASNRKFVIFSAAKR